MSHADKEFCVMKLSRSFRCACLASLLSASFYACDDSQSVNEDNPDNGEQLIQVLINEVEKGNIDALGLDASAYEDKIVGGEETRVVTIATLIQKALDIPADKLSDELARYTCNYESAADGFRPTHKGDKCAPVSCSNAVLSYLDVATGKLVYDDKFMDGKAPGCYQVKDLGKILMTEVNENAKLFTLYVDGQKMGEVDLGTLSDIITESDGKKVIKLGALVEKLQPKLDVSALLCDFSDAGGRMTSEDAKCPARACQDTLNAMIAVDSYDIVDKAGSDVAACYGQKDARALYMTTPETDKPLNIVIKLDDKELGTVDAKSLAGKIHEEEGSKYVLVSDVIEAAAQTFKIENFGLDKYACNYVGRDGYNPTDRGKCSELRSCTYAETAKLNLTTSKMSMTDAQAFGCHSVSELAQILLYTNKSGEDNPAKKSYMIKVVVDGDAANAVSVDAYDFEDKFTKVGDKDAVAASVILAAAIEAFDAAEYTCDYAASDGYLASQKSNCNPPRSCSYAETTMILLEDKKLDAEGGGCFNVSKFETIYVAKNG